MDTTTIGFGIGPILNACGRISDPNISTQFLCNGDLSNEELANLIMINNQRKTMTTEQYIDAEKLIQEQNLTNFHVIVVQGNFHEGIIGLLASRIAERYLKPAIVINEAGKGSARSVQNTDFSIVQVINDCSHYLSSFGGHQAAAGLSIEPCNINDFRQACHHAAEIQAQITPVVTYQFKIPFMLFPDTIMDQFNLLEPYGMHNPKPTFYTETWFDSCFSLGSSKEHFLLKTHNETVLAFRFNEDVIRPNKYRKMLYTINSTNKRDFLLIDIKS